MILRWGDVIGGFDSGIGIGKGWGDVFGVAIADGPDAGGAAVGGEAEAFEVTDNQVGV